MSLYPTSLECTWRYHQKLGLRLDFFARHGHYWTAFAAKILGIELGTEYSSCRINRPEINISYVTDFTLNMFSPLILFFFLFRPFTHYEDSRTIFEPFPTPLHDSTYTSTCIVARCGAISDTRNFVDVNLSALH